ncbi:MAG: hypothetical protein KA314_09585 [Chloroflexi bacterium]|nr:hypothetical protein [Chloroflexota bacterium]MBP8056082.1 hypothetical protein [Chloroflexota bacterium]
MNMTNFGSAVEDFHRARRQVALEKILGYFTSESLDLLSYEEVRRHLRPSGQIERGLQEIPLVAIVGSVGRYRDFTRTFLPRHDADAMRWAQVKVAHLTQGVPPITVYQIGGVYFVQDGNHRVSVARQMGNNTIEAYVTELKTAVPLGPDVQPDDLILKAEYADFLATTRLDVSRPQADLSLTSPGRYPLILEHIAVHRYFMGLEQQRDITYEEAVSHWYDFVYLPVVQLMEEYGLLQDFPARTEADLYVWLAQHRAEIEAEWDEIVQPDMAVAHLAAQLVQEKPSAPRFVRALLQAMNKVESSLRPQRPE